MKRLLDAKYSRAFASKCVQIIRGMFRFAVREKLVDANPFEFVKAGSQVNNARKVFIDPDTVYKLIDTLPSAEWRLIVALARWEGLRTPSEPFAMMWDHVLWDQSRLIVPTPKLEHLPGKETRTIPIFPEVRPYLDAAWDAVKEREVYIFPHLRRLSGNLGTMLRKYILRAGLQPWPRTWQNLRASRCTELADRFPSHVASAWLGHSNEIADRHYRSVLDSHFEAAIKTTQNPTQNGEEMGGKERNGKLARRAKTPEKQAFPDVLRKNPMGVTGFEPVTSTV